MEFARNSLCTKAIIHFFALSLLFKFGYSSTNEYGILAAESSSEKENFCIIYFKDFDDLPNEKSKAEFHILQDDSTLDWCEDHPETDPKSKVLLTSKGNCSISTQALNIQDRGGKGVLFITTGGKVRNYNLNDSDAESINITVGLISENSANRLKKMDNAVTVRLFSPESLNFDFSLLIIWIIAMFTISVGSYWSGHVRFALYYKEMYSLPGGDREFPNKPAVKVHSEADISALHVKPYFVAIFVAFMGLMLVALYVFYDFLVYIIIGLFVLASILGLYDCLNIVVMKIKESFCRFDFRCGSISCHLDFRQILLAAFSIALPVYWVIIRKQKYAWVLQDILGIAFCIHMLKTIRLPNLKIITIMLVLLFFYDIFFVFITPFLTMKGESIMEEVATGGKSDELLPMVLRVSHLGLDPLSVCYQQFSLLGYGDILVPGLLTSYCHGFDLVTNKRKVYFLTSLAMYGIGLLVTYVGLFLMSTAQPALLYLVPCTILPLVLLGWCRGELLTLWNGFQAPVDSTDTEKYPEVQVATTATVSEVLNDASVLPNVESYIPREAVNTSAPANNGNGERNCLLR